MMRVQIIGALLCLFLGMLSGHLAGPVDHAWYITLRKPFFTPPNWLFAPVWTLLYIMMGAAAGRIWQQRNAPKGNLLPLLFALQFILNLLWSPLFFGLHSPELAMIDIALIWLSLMCLIWYSCGAVRWLLVPTTVWISFAALLNASILYYNFT